MTLMPMIKTLEIFNYRSCVNTKLNLQSDLSVFIGPNGSGKTNILKAFMLLSSLTSEREAFYPEIAEPGAESQLKATFINGGKKSILTAKINIHTDEHNDDVITDSNQSWYAKDFTGNRSRINIPLSTAWLFYSKDALELSVGRPRRLPLMHFKYSAGSLSSSLDKIPQPFRTNIYKIHQFLRDVKYYSASQFTNPSLCPVSFEVEQEGSRRRAIRIRGHSQFLFDLHSLYKKGENSTYSEFFNVVGPNGIGLVRDIKFNEILTSSIEYSVRSGGKITQRKREKLLVIPQFIIGKDELSPSQLSEGTFKTITLLFYLMTEKSSALLIEEPEVCVHHGLLSSIVELIKAYSKQKQILVSTHSDFVLDQIEPRHVYGVGRSEEFGTTVAHVTKAMSTRELHALKKYLKSEGNLGEYWRHGGLD